MKKYGTTGLCQNFVLNVLVMQRNWPQYSGYNLPLSGDGLGII